MTEKQRMLAGQLYHAGDAALQAERLQARQYAYEYNNTAPKEQKRRTQILNEWLDCPSGDAYLEVPVRIDYGANLHVGRHFYANYDAIFLDIAPITIGDNVLFGPRVGLYTAGHPLAPSVRNAGLEHGQPITIGDNVWLGGNVTVCPGVTIGANTIVAAGAVVSHDLPANVLAGGVPATVLRPLTATDRADWEAQRQAYFEVQGVTLRTAQPADLDAIMAIENAGFTPDEAATKASMQDRIAQYPDTFIVAVDHDQIIGYIVGPAYQERYLSDDLFGAAQPNLAADKAPYQTILSLAVAPQAQRRGLGGLLLAALQEIAEAQGRQAITLTCLQRLVPFYAANGYINEGVSASTHAGEQWFNMVLPLGTLA